jgi:hypothetical protein
MYIGAFNCFRTSLYSPAQTSQLPSKRSYWCGRQLCISKSSKETADFQATPRADLAMPGRGKSLVLLRVNHLRHDVPADVPEHDGNSAPAQKPLSGVAALLPTRSADAVQSLRKHLELAKRHVGSSSLSLSIIEGDAHVLNDLASLLNSQRPELNLVHVMRPDLLGLLEKMPVGSQLRCVLNTRDSATAISHSTYLDIQRQSSDALSILFIEPAANGTYFEPVMDLLGSLESSAACRNIRVAVFTPNVQFNPSDCRIACVEFALASYDSQPKMSIYHEHHRCGRPAGDKDFEWKGHALRYSVPKIKKLPLAFFKHMESLNMFREIFGSLPKKRDELALQVEIERTGKLSRPDMHFIDVHRHSLRDRRIELLSEAIADMERLPVMAHR